MRSTKPFVVFAIVYRLFRTICWPQLIALKFYFTYQDDDDDATEADCDYAFILVQALRQGVRVARRTRQPRAQDALQRQSVHLSSVRMCVRAGGWHKTSYLHAPRYDIT